MKPGTPTRGTYTAEMVLNILNRWSEGFQAEAKLQGWYDLIAENDRQTKAFARFFTAVHEGAMKTTPEKS